MKASWVARPLAVPVFVCALVLVSAVAVLEAAAPVLRVVVDPRVELMSIVFRLAGNPEYSQGRVASYVKDVEARFGPQQEHEVVRMARDLRATRGVSYDAVMSYAVHLTDGIEAAVPFSPVPASLDGRWRTAEATRFLGKLKQFAAATGSDAFFKEHAGLYAEAVAKMEAVAVRDGDIAWFDRFFGARPGARFTVVLGMLNGGSCYGARRPADGGKEDLYCILGVWSTDASGAPQFDRSVLGTVAHEFGHAYVNPLVYRNEDRLRGSGERLYRWVADEMRGQAYGNWVTMIHESVVRASVVRYLAAHDGPEAAAKEIREQIERRHFPWMSELVDRLVEYEGHRDKYPDFGAFFPRVIEFFDAYAPGFEERMKMADAKAPRVVSIVPANGATDVDPGLDAIVVTFDRRMKASYSFVGGGPNYPETVGRPRYDQEGKTVTLKVKLKPDWRYEFWLNREQYASFRSEEGAALKSVHVEFRTRAAR
jgi:hypothetical protein